MCRILQSDTITANQICISIEKTSFLFMTLRCVARRHTGMHFLGIRFQKNRIVYFFVTTGL